MITSREVFSARKEGRLDEAYTMATDLIQAAHCDTWGLKAFSWCVIDLIKRDVGLANLDNIQKYADQLKGTAIDKDDAVLNKQRDYALSLCGINGQDISSAKALTQAVFSKRKEGHLDEAYKMAVRLLKNPQHGDWGVMAFAWCLVDLIKREANSNNEGVLRYYAEQLESLDVDSFDEVLIGQINYASRLCTVNGQDILKAKSLSKEGNHQASIAVYKKIYNNGDSSDDVQVGLAWELYRYAKVMIDQDPPNASVAKNCLNDYFKLQIEKPSLLHSCILQLAAKLAKTGTLNMSIFCRMWGLENLRPDDYEQFVTDDDETYPCLAEKVIQQATKDAVKLLSSVEMLYLYPFIEECISRFPNNLWLKLSKAKVLVGLGRYDEAIPCGLEIAKNNLNDFWAWELLGDIYKLASPKYALGCYSKALICSRDINFVSKVKIKFAELLVENNLYPEAALEIREVTRYRVANSQKVPESAEQIANLDWYNEQPILTSNQNLYVKYAPLAEEAICHDLPWINGIIGDVYFTEHKPDIPRRKIYMQSKGPPLEISVLESKMSINYQNSSDGVSIKGEFDNKNNFQVYCLQERDTDNKWDIFEELVGVVGHVNPINHLLYFVVNHQVSGVIMQSALEDTFVTGDAILVRVSKYSSRQGIRYRTHSAKRTSIPVPETLVKPFEEIVEVNNGLGFTVYSNIFIPPDLVRLNNIRDQSCISGKAILSYNKKKSKWGWKAMSIQAGHSA
jgi:tetratricopeptide (TPR) repeat protein